MLEILFTPRGREPLNRLSINRVRAKNIVIYVNISNTRKSVSSVYPNTEKLLDRFW